MGRREAIVDRERDVAAVGERLRHRRRHRLAALYPAATEDHDDGGAETIAHGNVRVELDVLAPDPAVGEVTLDANVGGRR
jgi:hypothetical protein